MEPRRTCSMARWQQMWMLSTPLLIRLLDRSTMPLVLGRAGPDAAVLRAKVPVAPSFGSSQFGSPRPTGTGGGPQGSSGMVCWGKHE